MMPSATTLAAIMIDTSLTMPTAVITESSEKTMSITMICATTAIIELAGPREVSYDDLAAELSTILGKKVATVHVPRAGVKGALMQAGLGEDLAGLYDEMTAGVDAGLVAYEQQGARSQRGTIEPREVLTQLAG